MLSDIRLFFLHRQVLEVETPLLCHAAGTDPQLDFFSCKLNFPSDSPELFLQTSPEFAMKRLLAAGSGSIFQICKAFRNGESGRWHNPEFTMLEWYRLNFDLQALMTETAALLQSLLLPANPAMRIEYVSYRQLFLEMTGLDALAFDLSAYHEFANAHGYPEAVAICADQQTLWLDFLFSHCVQPQMPENTILLVHAYPSAFSSLARIDSRDPRVAERFEVFVGGVELGNGFFELTDAEEQEARFDREIAYRRRRGLRNVIKDRRLLAALRAGLPDCSGVAIGLDRLLMLIAGSRHIEEVLAFPLRNA
jgi:lysyl-tRNA synthetase class 2